MFWITRGKFLQGGSTTKPRKTLPLNGAKEVSLATLPSTTKLRRTLPLNGATLYHRTTQTLPPTRASSATEWSRLYHQTTHPIPPQRTTALLSGFFIRPLLYILIKEYLSLPPWLAPGGKGQKENLRICWHPLLLLSVPQMEDSVFPDHRKPSRHTS